MSTHNLCFRAKIRKNVYPCKPQFNYIKVGCKGVLNTRTCYPDELNSIYDGSDLKLIILVGWLSVAWSDYFYLF